MNKKILLKMIDKSSIAKKNKYLLSPNSFSNEDILKASQVLFSKKITMGKITKIFEKKFAKFIGSKYALMVNSGSSANLLAMFALINPLKKKFLKPGDECLIPALCWSTSLWPIVQAGLKPKFVDVDPMTLNISIKDLTKLICSITNYQGKIEYDKSKPNGTYRKLIDSSKIKKINWKPNISLIEGISSIIKNFK